MIGSISIWKKTKRCHLGFKHIKRCHLGFKHIRYPGCKKPWVYTTWLRFGFNCLTSCQQIQFVQAHMKHYNQQLHFCTSFFSFFNSWRQKIITHTCTQSACFFHLLHLWSTHPSRALSSLSLYPPHCAPIHFSHVPPPDPHPPFLQLYPKARKGWEGGWGKWSGVCVVENEDEKWGAGETTNPCGEHCSIPTPQVTCPPSLPPSLLLCLPRFPPGPHSIVPLTPLPLSLFLKEQFWTKSKRCLCSLASSHH